MTRKMKKTRIAFSVGNRDGKTSYLKTRDVNFSAYVAEPTVDDPNCFTSSEARALVYADGVLQLRAESLIKHALLKRAGLTTAESWRRYGGESAYRWADTLLKRRLRMAVPLRKRLPRPRDLERLGAVDREMVEMHLRGEDARTHTAVQRHQTRLEQQKFMSAVKLRLLAKVKIDLDLKWPEQVEIARADLPLVMADSRKYTIPSHLRQYCFTHGTAARLIRELTREIALAYRHRLLREALGGPNLSKLMVIDVGPPGYDSELIDFRRLTVSPAARKVLNAAKRPLYPLLHCHGLHVFGDIALDEAVYNLEARDRRLRVRSRYRTCAGAILVTTVYKPDDHGELLPFVHVSAETEEGS